MKMNDDLLSYFENLPDPRIDRTKRYPLIEIILLIISATISGCEGWKEIKDFGDTKLDWLRKFLPYEEGIPVDDTIARVMRKLETKAFQTCFINWVNSISKKTDGDVVAIDGKTLRRSHDQKRGQSAIHMVSAWSSRNGLVLGQEKTSEKSNEITAIPELLEVLEIKGCIVTIDSMGCQTKIASQIVKKKADYILALKGNQGILHGDVQDYFATSLETHFDKVKHDYYECVEKGHGRIEHRQCWAITPDKDCFSTIEKWEDLKSIVMVKSQRDMGDKVTNDTRFYISSLDPDAKKLLEATRAHWQVENCLHWTLDVTFREDELRVRADAAPENFAVMRHIALNLIKSDTSLKASVKRKRLRAALDDDFREVVMRQAI
jgi:predicted transposase YbfD/YdcC